MTPQCHHRDHRLALGATSNACEGYLNPSPSGEQGNVRRRLTIANSRILAV